ncbi:MAG TPA: hypothetical protein VGH20_12490 [Myxococcales bacterium]|jgi:hypothetical protein
MLFLVVCCAITTSADAAAQVARWNSEIASKISAVNAATTVDLRAERAESLLESLRRGSSTDLTQANVDGVISLLDLEPDAVHESIALCIQRIGRRALAAAPKLREILASMRCFAERGEVRVGYERTSEPVVRAALQSLGETPPPTKCVPPYDAQHWLTPSRRRDAGQPAPPR